MSVSRGSGVALQRDGGGMSERFRSKNEKKISEKIFYKISPRIVFVDYSLQKN